MAGFVVAPDTGPPDVLTDPTAEAVECQGGPPLEEQESEMIVSPPQEPFLKQVATVSFFVLDIGWITCQPEIGLTGMLVALGSQSLALQSEVRSHCFSLGIEIGLLLWVVGNSFWMCSEYLWGDPEPAGFLNDLPFMRSLSTSYDQPMMIIGSVFMVGASFVCLLAFAAAAGALQRFRISPMRCDRKVLCLPLDAYMCMYLLPWLLQDAIWCVGNMLTVGTPENPIWAVPVLMGVCGAMSFMLGSDCIWRLVKQDDKTRMLLSTGEVLWVLGNVAWSLEDVLTDDKSDTAKQIALALFVVGLCLTMASFCVQRYQRPDLIRTE